MTHEESGPFSVLAAPGDSNPSAARPGGVTTAGTTLPAIDQLLRIEEIANAEFLVGDLFRRRFGSNPPDVPTHFVALYRAAANCYVTVGYVHFRIFDDLCLCGGMTEDDRALRRMPALHQTAIKAAGGVCTILLRDSLARLVDAPAVWACVGEAPVREELRRAGFAPVDDPYIMVRWHRELADTEQQALLAKVKLLGHF